MTIKQWRECWRAYWQKYVQWQAHKKAAQAKQKARKHRQVTHPLKVQVIKPVLWRTSTEAARNKAEVLEGLVHALWVEPKKPKQ